MSFSVTVRQNCTKPGMKTAHTYFCFRVFHSIRAWK